LGYSCKVSYVDNSSLIIIVMVVDRNIIIKKMVDIEVKNFKRKKKLKKMKSFKIKGLFK